MSDPPVGNRLEHLKPEGNWEPGATWVPATDADRDAVREQVKRILDAPQFKTSTRGPALFRYIVETALAGRTDMLKERTLGVEVFGREPTYDTNLDPVVRVTASRIRHRIAQYYEEPGHENEIQIIQPSGSYMPVFYQPATNLPPREATHEHTNGVVQAESATVAADPPPESPLPAPVRTEPGDERLCAALRTNRRWRLGAYVAAAAALGIALLWFDLSRRRNDPEVFWAPMLDSPEAVLVCTGTGLDPIERDAARPDSGLTIVQQRRRDVMSWSDAITFARLTGFLTQERKAFKIQKDSNTSLELLRSGPAVFVGAFNNRWAMRLTPSLRFRFENDKTGDTMSIVDTQAPARREWSVVKTMLFSEFKEDYGVITRILDPTTERHVVLAGGLGSYGTIAAGEFLTTPRYLKMLVSRAPSGWQKKNLQVVFKTRVIEGNSGPPQILDVHFW